MSKFMSVAPIFFQVELQINTPTNVPEWLFVMFAVCTTVLVAVHIFALMISTYILPNIEAIAKLEVCEMVTESPHERMKGFIEIAWAFSTILGEATKASAHLAAGGVVLNTTLDASAISCQVILIKL